MQAVLSEQASLLIPISGCRSDLLAELCERAVFRRTECHWIYVANAKTAAAMNSGMRPRSYYPHSVQCRLGNVVGEG